MPDCNCHIEAKNKAERKTLGVLLIINGLMFIIGMIAGIIAGSTALVADSLDMFADATVYAISLYAVGKSPHQKNRAAILSGIFQITLAVMVLVDIIQRFIFGRTPESHWMMGIASLSLIANSYGLFLISRYRKGEIHMRASWIFTQNDVIANCGVIIAGLLVAVFNSRFPDLMVGIAIVILVMMGGIGIIRDTQSQKDKPLI